MMATDRDHPHPHPHPHASDHDHPHPHPHDHAHPHVAASPVATQPSAADAHDHPHPHPHPHGGDQPSGGEHGHAHGASGDEHGHDHGHAHGHDHGPGGHYHDHEHGHEHHTGLRGFIQELINPHTHDAADRVDAAMESSEIGVRTLKVSLAIMLATALVQAVIVAMSGSIALLADTIHNFADALTSIPLWIAFVLGRRAATRRYTYGYGRAEDVAGVVIVLIILGSALLAAWEAFQKILNPEPMNYVAFVAAASIVGFIGNEAVAIYRIRTGKQIGSAALVADGYHARGDGLTSLAVLLGVAGTLLGYPIADPIVGIGISIAILLITKDAALSIWHRVMDAVDPAIIDRLEGAAASVPEVQAVEDVRARWLGHRLEADLRVVVDCDLRTAESHAIGENVRHALFHAESKLASIVVHTDPCDHDGRDHHELTAGHTRRFASSRGK